MSFILNAVKKQQGQQASTPTTNHQPPVTASNQNPSFIAWGILLTLAIFAALLAGFYLGQSKNPQALTPPVMAVSHLETTASNQVSNHQQAKATPVKNASVKVTTNTQLASKAEAMFDGASASTSNQNSALPTADKAEHNGDAQSQQPKILGYQPEQAQFDDFSVDKSKLAGVSDELIAKFEQAIKATSNTAEVTKTKAQLAQPSQPNIEDHQPIDINSVQPLTELSPSFQQRVPKLIFSQHVYASNGKGLVQVNGEQAQQGSVLANGVKIVKIEPQQVILSYQQQLFSLSALAEWQ